MQLVLFMSVIVGLVFTSIITYYIIDNFYTGMDDMNLNNDAMNTAETHVRTQFAMIDYALIFFMIALIGGLVITTFFIPTHPIFFAINILGIFVLIFIGIIMSNTFGELTQSEGATDAGIKAAADEMLPKSTILINLLPFIAAIVLGIVSIVMFAKGQGGGGY